MASLGSTDSWFAAFDEKAYELWRKNQLDAVAVLTPDEYWTLLTARDETNKPEVDFFRPKVIGDTLGLDDLTLLQTVRDIAIAHHGDSVRLELNHGQVSLQEDGETRLLWLLLIVQYTKKTSGQRVDMKQLH